MTVVEATAPCRVDLAGGGLDVWPVYLFHPGAVGVSIAIDRRCWCRVETGLEGVELQSKDTLHKAEGATVSEVLETEGLSEVAHVLNALGVERGVRVVTQSRVPAGSGLGASSSLAVAVAAAASRALGGAVDPDALWPLLRDAEARATAAPAGIQDYHPALRGGAVAVHLGPGEVRVERLEADPGRIEECLLLIDPGGTCSSAPVGWEIVKGQIDGDERIRRSLATIASVARGIRQALVEGRFEDIVDLVAEDWEARKQLAPGATTPEIDRVAAVVRSAGGAAKACGAGGGGVVAVWAPPGERGPGRREAVEAALTAAGCRVFAARVDLRGLELD